MIQKQVQPQTQYSSQGQEIKGEAKCWSMKLNYSQKDHVNFHAFTGDSTQCLKNAPSYCGDNSIKSSLIFTTLSLMEKGNLLHLL